MVTQNRDPRPSDRLLAEVASLWGVQTGYRDAFGTWRESPRESVVRVMQALGAFGDDCPARDDGVLGDPGDEDRLRGAGAAAAAAATAQIVEPVLVAWDGLLPRAVAAGIAAASGAAKGRGAGAEGPARSRGTRLTLSLEDGEERQWEVAVDAARPVLRAAREAPLSGGAPGRAWGSRLPFGYHTLRVDTERGVAEAAVISAPRLCWSPGGHMATGGGSAETKGEPSASGTSRPDWGLFAPLYGLRDRRDWGAGDLADLRELRDMVGAAGGSVVATLPLLASYLEEPFEPCPYRPVSRLFWNELYLAVEEIAEWREDPRAREAWAARETQAAVDRLRADPLVDYRGVMALKRKALESLCDRFYAHAGSERREALAAYLRARPDALEYAVFRAQVEALGVDWRGFSERDMRAVARPKALDDLAPAERYHLYCQWQMDEQLAGLAGERPEVTGRGAPRSAAAPSLFLDLPVGVHPGGFDTFKWRESFISDMSVGAPPDAFFPTGQTWDSPPLHPRRARQDAHRYFSRCLRTHMRFAGHLRIDHVMALHRLFWIPEGRGPDEGVYVSYPADELYAVLCLESHRHRTVVVGEDLGVVPPDVRPAMRRHGLLGTWVLQGSLRPRADSPIRPPSRHAVAMLGTHDMFPFAAYIRGDDVDARPQVGRLDAHEASTAAVARSRLIERLSRYLAARRGEGRYTAESPVRPFVRAPDQGRAAGLLGDVIRFLMRSPAAVVLVNLDDLLLQTEPQNVPGTGPERGNWRGKTSATLHEMRRMVLGASDRPGSTD